MTDDLVLTDVRADGVATLRLNRPPMNPLSQALLREVADAALALGADDQVKAVVVLGSEKAFAAGADIKEFGDQAAAKKIGRQFRAAFDRVAAIPRPVIAAINGFALGGGMELALSCDLRVAGETARLGQPEILLGIIPGAGGTQRLARLLGPARAKDLVFSGRFVDAQEALRIGLVDRVVAPDDAYTAAREMAGRYVEGPAMALRAAKAAIDGGLDGDLASGLRLETALFTSLFATEDRTIGMTSFVQNGPGKAAFVGR